MFSFSDTRTGPAGHSGRRSRHLSQSSFNAVLNLSHTLILACRNQHNEVLRTFLVAFSKFQRPKKQKKIHRSLRESNPHAQLLLSFENGPIKVFRPKWPTGSIQQIPKTKTLIPTWFAPKIWALNSVWTQRTSLLKFAIWSISDWFFGTQYSIFGVPPHV